MSLHTVLCVAVYCSSFILNDEIQSSNSREMTGTISSPGYPNTYPNGLKSKYTITVTEGRIIQIMFLEIEIEKDHDTIHISDEPGSSRLMDKDEILKPIYSTSNNITIFFNTDHSRTFSGFLLNFTEIDQNSTALNKSRVFENSSEAVPVEPTSRPSHVIDSSRITLSGLIGFIAGCFFTVFVTGAVFLMYRYRLKKKRLIQPSLLNVRHDDEVIYQNTPACSSHTVENQDERHYQNMLLDNEEIGSISNPGYGTHNLVIYNENHYIDMCIVQNSPLK